MEAQTVFIDIAHISLEDQEKYRGMDVALIDGEVVAAGYTPIEAFEKARQLFPNRRKEDIVLDYVPREEWLIL